MTAPTHITFSQLVYLLFLTTAGIPLNAWNALACALGSVLPDIDTEASYAGKLLPPLSRRIERRFAHRTLTHCWLFQAGLAVLLLPLSTLNSQLYFCFLSGYVSHSFLDSCTVNGVKLLYPFSMRKCVFPFDPQFPHSFRAATGGKLDRFLGILFLVCCIPLYFIANEGYARAIRLWQKDIRSAVSDFGEFSRSHIVYADLRGTSSITNDAISGRFEVVGSLNDHTLIIRSPDGSLNSIGDPYEANYAAKEITCLKGELSRTVVQQVEVSNQYLSQLKFYLRDSTRTYFFGSLMTEAPVALSSEFDKYNPIEFRRELHFNYATYGDVLKQHLEDVFITRGELIVKSILTSRSDTTVIPYEDARFALVSFQAGGLDAVTLLVEKGDTLALGQTIAAVNAANSDELRSIDLLNMRRAEKDSSVQIKLADLSARIEVSRKAESELERQLQASGQMLDRGFFSPVAVDRLRDRLVDVRGKLRMLERSRQFTVQGYETDVRDLNLRLSRIREKIGEKERRSEIRAGAGGIVSEILRRPLRAESRAGYEFTVIIKRSGGPTAE